MKSNPYKKIIFLLLVILDAGLLISVILQSKIFFTVALDSVAQQEKITNFNRKKIKIEKFNAKDLRQERAKLKIILSDKTLVFEVIREVKSIAQTLNVSPVKVTLLSEEAKQFKQLPVSAISFEMKFRCEYGQFIDFIRRIENMPHLLTVSHLEVLRSKDKLPAIDVSVVVNTYEKVTRNNAKSNLLKNAPVE